MQVQAFSANSITQSLVGFIQILRQYGLVVGFDESQQVLRTAHTPLIGNKLQFKTALSALCCTSREEQELFDQLFIAYWDTNPVDLAERKNKTTVRGSVSRKTNSSLVMLGQGKNTEEEQEKATITSGANDQESLRTTDFSKLKEMDHQPLDQLAERLFKEFAKKMRRRLKASRARGRLHLAKTIRKCIESGGDPLILPHRIKTLKKRRLVILLDVSGSMDKYSFYLLRFIYALKQQFSHLEAFVFSTHLIPISKALKRMKLENVLEEIAAFARHWSGGTRIGECLEDFNRRYSKFILHGSPAVLILSDGLETGNPILLSAEMERISRRSKTVIWLNPLKGMNDYQPLAAGMQAALPFIRHFRPAHNLQSLLDLEELLSHV